MCENLSLLCEHLIAIWPQNIALKIADNFYGQMSFAELDLIQDLCVKYTFL